MVMITTHQKFAVVAAAGAGSAVVAGVGVIGVGFQSAGLHHISVGRLGVAAYSAHGNKVLIK